MIFRMITFMGGYGMGFCSGVVWTVGSMYYVEYVPKMISFIKDGSQTFDYPFVKKIVNDIQKEIEKQE